MNRIDFSQDPAALFLNPATDPHLRPVAEPGFYWRERPRARILGFSASGNEATTQRIEGHLAQTARHRTFTAAVEFNTIPVVLRQAEYVKNFVTAGGKAVLGGAAGVRALNNWRWKHEAEDHDTRIADWMEAAREARSGPPLMPPDPDTAGLPFAVEARNTFNYFHFVTETLCQFCLLDDLGHDRPLFLHHPDAPAKTRAFTRGFLTALFPEFGARVQFRRTPQRHDRVLTAFNLMQAHYLCREDEVPSLDPLIASREFWAGRRATRRGQGVLQMNAVDTSLYRLRERALRAIEGRDFSHLPTRFWIGREHGHARARVMGGEDALVEALAPLGFRRISFESLSPLEQVALMARAEVMVSAHGAGFTNMLFANPAAHVIEIGTLQTAMFRWGDFWRLANASGCTYVSFYADMARDDPLTDPGFTAVGLVPAVLSPAGIEMVRGHVAALLGQPPLLDGPQAVQRLAGALNRSGAHARTVELFARHPGIEAGDPALCTLLAEALHATGDAVGELRALRAAHLADPGRAFTLVQMVWRAVKAGRDEDLQWALARMRDAFPERLDELLQARPFLRRLAG